MNELINDEAVYRTAPATPGLLKTSTLLFNVTKVDLKWLVIQTWKISEWFVQIEA